MAADDTPPYPAAIDGRSEPPPRASDPPEAEAERAAGAESERTTALPPVRWKANLVLFVLTVGAVMFTGGEYAAQYDHTLPKDPSWGDLLRAAPQGWRFAVPLLAILLTHEFGHYFAARWHKVDASLPYFLPMPLISPFGTMGAVISMRGRIRSRNALLDIGASGPLAGLVVAIPVLVAGLSRSKVGPLGEHYIQEGQSLLYVLLKRVVLGPIPAGHDVDLSPLAFAGWTGLFVTTLNLIPIAQLDGGHIAYALFGTRQNRIARVLHVSLLGMFALNLARFLLPAALAGKWGAWPMALGNSAPWLVWYFLLRIIMRVSGRDHPPTEPGELSPLRKGLAVLSLALFVLLFMPTPWAQY